MTAPPNKSLDASGGSVFSHQTWCGESCVDSRRRVNSDVMRLCSAHINRVLLLPVFLFLVSMVNADTPRKFDEIRVLTSPELRLRLDNLVSYLRKEPPDVVVYLIAYAGPSACIGEADLVNPRAKNYLVAKHKIASGRLFLVDGGYREQPMLEIWMWSSRNGPPHAFPTIDRTQVRLKNCWKRASVHRRRA